MDPIGHMFIRAEQLDVGVIAFFDEGGFKHIRKGGTLAWRTRNPGLIHSHSNIASRHRVIGHVGQIPIFGSILDGKGALREWLRLNTYYNSPLYEIAMYFCPDDALVYVEELSALSGLDQSTLPSKLSASAFENLAYCIEMLSGAYQTKGDEKFYVLPQLCGRFSSRGCEVDCYLTSDNKIVSKEVAIQLTLNHQLDAVVVQMHSGTRYLRSRPGRFFRKIYFKTDKPDSDLLPDINEVVRDAGSYRNGQPILGYINGLSNNNKDAAHNLSCFSQAVNGLQVWGFINYTGRENLLGLTDLVRFEMLFPPPKLNHLAVQYLRFLLKQHRERGGTKKIIVVGHSEGSLILKGAIKKLKEDEQKHFALLLLGAIEHIHPEETAAKCLTVVNEFDPAVRVMCPHLMRIATRRDLNKNKINAEIAQELATEELVLNGTDSGIEYEIQHTRLTEYYKVKLMELKNFRVLYGRSASGIRGEHEFMNTRYVKSIEGFVSENE